MILLDLQRVAFQAGIGAEARALAIPHAKTPIRPLESYPPQSDQLLLHIEHLQRAIEAPQRQLAIDFQRKYVLGLGREQHRLRGDASEAGGDLHGASADSHVEYAGDQGGI